MTTLDQDNISQKPDTNFTNVDQNKPELIEKDLQDEQTKTMTKAEKKVYELKKKLDEANKALEEEKEIEKQKNQQEIIKLLAKKELDLVDSSKWKIHIDEIVKLLKN